MVKRVEANRLPSLLQQRPIRMEYTVAAVDEALGLLIIVGNAPGLGVTELARRSGNTKARAYRLLTTLEGRGFVQRRGDPAVYQLGNQALLMGLAAQEQVGLVTLANPHLQELLRAFNETVHLRIRDGVESVCVALAESTRDVRVGTHVGKRRPLYAGSSGKLLLAFADEDVQQHVLNGDLAKLTSNTLPKTKLVRELAQIKAQGYAMSLGEVSAEIHSVAAPVRDASGEVIASLGISAPVGRGTEKQLKAFADKLLQRAGALSKELGYRTS